MRLLFLFMAQEPRYGRFLSFINNIQKAEIEIQKIKIAKKTGANLTKPLFIWVYVTPKLTESV